MIILVTSVPLQPGKICHISENNANGKKCTADNFLILNFYFWRIFVEFVGDRDTSWSTKCTSSQKH